MLNKSILHCTRDIELMCQRGIPYHKALRHMTYLINYQEYNRQRAYLEKKAKEKQHEFNYYKQSVIDKNMHMVNRRS